MTASGRNVIEKVVYLLILEPPMQAIKSQAPVISSNDFFEFSAATSQESVSYYNDSTTSFAVRYFYPQDLIGDGSQEIIVAGFETQPNTPEDYSNTRLHIVGITNGELKALTNAYLPSRGSYIEGAGDITFGDFNGDGRKDFFTSAYTDMDHAVNAYAFYSDGDEFSRHTVDKATWQHGVASLDINGDGFDDIYAASFGDGASIYLGGTSGLAEYQVRGAYGGGSHVALGDFLDNGSIQAVVTDSAAPNGGTSLFSISVDEDTKTAILGLQSILPTPRLNTGQFDTILTQDAPRSHDVRVEALDFSNDGQLDVVVFSRADNDPDTGKWPEISQVQFLRNEGNGTFKDVTSIVLPKYYYESNIGYVPVFDDFNGDGFTDIFISDSDFQGLNNSSVFLFGSAGGNFKEVGRDNLSEVVPSSGGMATVAKNDTGDYFLLVGEQGDAYSGSQETLSLHQISFKDTSLFSGSQSNYTLSIDPTSVKISDRSQDTADVYQLDGTERLDFDSGTFDLKKFGGTAGLSEQNFEAFIELYIAYFNRAPDAVGLNFWGSAFANGMSLDEIAAEFAPQPETVATYPEGTSNTEFVTTVYNNILGRGPDQGGLDFWVNGLEEGGLTRDTFILKLLGGVEDGNSDRAYLDNKVDIGAYFAVHKGMSDGENAKAVMDLFGNQDVSNTSGAKAAIDDYYADALDPTNGEFLLQVVGVLDDPFSVA